MDQVLRQFELTIAKKFNKDIRVVHHVCTHPFFFLKSCIEGNDNRPIRIRYFGVFTQKYILNKSNMLENVYKKLLEDNNNLSEEINQNIKNWYENKDLKNLNKLYKQIRKNKEL